MNPFTIAILGGDRRLCYTANDFSKIGIQILGFGMAAYTDHITEYTDFDRIISEADAVLLPVPMSRDGKTLFAPALEKPLEIAEILAKTPQNIPIFGGIASAFQDSRLIDYGIRSDFASMGAIPTAEGALLLAIEQLPCTVSRMNVGIVGFGKIGKATASLFRAAGADVAVFARREEVCTVATHLGYTSASIADLPEYAGEFRCLVNTVPALVIGDSVLCRMRKDVLILELASAPYGVDFEIAKKLGIHTVLAGGLPGKYAPEAAGEAVFQTVYTILKEKNFITLN